MADDASDLHVIVRDSARLGDFIVDGKLPDVADRMKHGTAVAAVGVPGTKVSGRRATAYRLTAPDPAVALDALRRRTSLQHPNLQPVLFAGVSGELVYTVEPDAGARMSARLRPSDPFDPSGVAAIVSDLAAALTAAHEIGLGHGQISPQVVWIDDARRVAVLGGLSVAPVRVDEDAASLALFAFELLGGEPWTGGADLSGAPLIEAIHARLPGLTHLLARSIGGAIDGTSIQHVATPSAFAASFRAAIEGSSAELLAHGHEAIGRGDGATASLVADLSARYVPDSEELRILRFRIGQSVGATNTASSVPGIPEPDTDGRYAVVPAHDPTIRLIAPSLFAVPVRSAARPRVNPWIVFMAGLFLLVLVFSILAAVSFNAS